MPMISMNPVYFETHFQCLLSWEDWPHAFAIITAYATTGEVWSSAKNEAADRRLAVKLKQQKAWLRRLTGYSPVTGHSEPGWAVALSFDIACNLGQEFYQEAIYYVVGDILHVSFCDHRRTQIPVGSFRSRVHLGKV